MAELHAVSLRLSSHPLLNFSRRGLISSDTYESIVPDTQMKEYVLSNEHFSFILLCLSFPGHPSFFIQAIIVEQGELGDILVSKSFPLPLESCSCRVMRPRALLLQNIILQSIDVSSLRYSLQTEDFTRSVINYERGVVLGEGDIVSMNPDNGIIYKYRIVHTFPFAQGVFSPPHAPHSLPQRVIILPSISNNIIRSIDNHLSASVVGPLIPKESSPFLRNSLCSGLGSLSLLPRRPSEKSISIESIQLIVKRLEKPRKQNQINPTPKHRDIHHEIFATIKTLSLLQIASGSWVILQISDEKNKEKRKYPARLFALDLSTPTDNKQDFKDGRVYLPPLVLHQLGIGAVQEFSSIRSFVSVFPFIRRRISIGNDINDDFPCLQASKVTIARVRSPNSAVHVSPQEFRNFLAEPRIVCVGDIIAIPRRRLGYIQYEDLVTDSENGKTTAGVEQSKNSLLYDELLDSIHCFEGTDAIDCTYTFFQVLDIKFDDSIEQTNNSKDTNSLFPNCAVVANGITSLFEVSSVNTSIPTCIEYFTQNKSFLPPAGMKNSFNELMTIISPFMTNQEQISDMYCSVLLHGIRGNGKRSLVKRVCQYLGIHVLEVNCFDLLGQGDTETTEGLRICFEQAHKLLPCILLLRHVEALEKLASQQQREPQVASALRECISSLLNDSAMNTTNPMKLITIATASKLDQLSSSIRSCFRHEVLVGVPEESQRRNITQFLFSEGEEESENSKLTDSSLCSFAPHSSAHLLQKSIALKTAGYSVSDLQSLISRAQLNSFSSILANSPEIPTVDELTAAGLTLVEECFDDGFGFLQKAHAEELGAPKIPNIQWDDVGGLVKAKKEILDTIQLPLEHPELFSHGVRQRSGVLLYGPPGTGKTLLAKAVATECSLNFLSVKGPELLNMYVGESEKNVRDVFEKARNAKPCVVFFDELDSLAPNRGQGSDSGGVMDRVVSQLLAELDGLQKAAEVFIIGATNRPDLLDSALLRPGRLDRLVYLGVCETAEEQIPILKALTRKFDLAEDVDLAEIASCCPTTFTGADFYALCSDTLLNAMKERIDMLDKLYKMTNISEEQKRSCIEISQNENLLIQRTHFMDALKCITPSVSFAELERYKKVRDQFS